MNCIRSLDCIKKLDNRYKVSGLITKIIYVPEWRFESKKTRLKRSSNFYSPGFENIFDLRKSKLKRLGINFWPAFILKKGKKIVHKNIGEGNYKKLEKVIRESLGSKGRPIFLKEPIFSKFPAVYAGKKKKAIISKIKKNIKFGTIYTKGRWTQHEEFIEGRGVITILAKGKKVYIVAGPSRKTPVTIRCLYKDKSRNCIIKEPRLYEIFKFRNNNKKIISISSKNRIKMYSFAFQ